jgi:alpha-tubulin suppressor-like RCC1 family protein
MIDGTLRCWGDNTYGQIGNGYTPVLNDAGGTTTLRSVTRPFLVPGLNNVIEVATGGLHTCALLADHTVRCWGDNDLGQLGQGSTTQLVSGTPVSVPGISNALHITAGYRFTCVVLMDRTVRCWGSWPLDPADGGVQNAEEVSGGFSHACIRLADGTARCFGLNHDGELGDGTRTTSSVPVVVMNGADAGLMGVAQIQATFQSTVARSSDGTLRSFGSHPTIPAGISGTDMVAVGGRHVCFRVQADRSVRCWGPNDEGELGDGTTVTRTTPVSIGLANVLQIAAGNRHTCALLATGEVRCWGYNGDGELGDGTTIERHSPTLVAW